MIVVMQVFRIGARSQTVQIGIVLLFMVFCTLASVKYAIALQSTAPESKIAFIADQGTGSDSVAVLNLIKSEGAQAVVHAGDYDYLNDPAAFDSLVQGTLGTALPYFGSVGNHDDQNWTTPNGGYQAVLERRSPGFCTGQRGVLASCKYNGLHILELGVGTMTSSDDPTQVNFIRSQFSSSDSLWRVCSWHQNQTAMQVGGKSNSVGWAAYEACREAGALIITGHEHSYSRTKTLTQISTQTVDSTCSSPTQLCVGPNRTFVTVSGIAGKSIRNQDRCLPTTPPYGCNGEWASIYTSDQGAEYGALFITFNYQGNPNRAHGYFKNINGVIIDEFDITADGSAAQPSTPPPSGCALKNAGDADCDGAIQLTDFELWRKEYLQIVSTTNADFDGSTTVTIADFQVWRQGYFTHNTARNNSSWPDRFMSRLQRQKQ